MDTLRAKLNKFHIIIISILLLIILMQFDELLVPLLFIVLGAAFWLMIRPFPMIGMEMSFVGVVIVSALYGSTAGIFTGLAGMMIGRIIVMEFQVGFLYDMIGYFVIGFIAANIPISLIPMMGTVLSLLYNIIALLFRYITGQLVGIDFAYAGTNFLFQAFIFFKLFPLVLTLFN